MWNFCNVLPNFDIAHPIESVDFAIVSPGDARIKDKIGDANNPLSFLDRFVDVQKEKITPAVLLYNKRNKKHRPSERDVYQFRNIVTICFIAYSIAKSLAEGRTSPIGPICSDHFLLYPYALNIQQTAIVGNTWHGNQLIFHDDFLGQPQANLLHHSAFDPNIAFDATLFQVLNKTRLNSKKGNSEKNLFRSLEVAFAAGISPFETRASIHTIGARIILWVSALEILSRKIIQGDASFKNTIQLFLKLPFCTKSIHKKNYKLLKLGRCDFCQKICENLYKLRHDYAHGNETTAGRLYWKRKNRFSNITHLAPILYTIALYCVLGIPKLPNVYERALLRIKEG